MKNTLIHLFIFLFLASGSFAQTPQYHWMNQLGGIGNDNGGYITVDQEGNVYTASYISSDASFKPLTSKEFKFNKISSASMSDLIITKVDAAGNLIWYKQIEGIVSVATITSDQNSNIILAGIYTNTVDFDPGAGVYNQTSKDGGDIFILKLDKNGDFIWAGSIGGKNGDRPQLLVTDKNNNIALVCQISDTVDFDISTTGIYNLIATSSFEAAVLKMSQAGKFLWAYHTKNIQATAIKFDNSDNLYITGSYSGTKDFDFGTGVFNMTATGSSSSEDIYIQKLDTAGKFIWAKSVGEFINNDNPNCITIDKSNNVIIAGSCGGGNSDFDPGSGVVNLIGNTRFILKLDSLGKYVWAKGFTGSIDFIKINVNDSSHIYASGAFGGIQDFDPGTALVSLTSLSSSDGYILRLDSNGQYNWVLQFTATNSLFVRSAFVSKGGNVFLGGVFREKVDFDPGTVLRIDSSQGNLDVFTLKLSRCIMNSTLSLSECKHFKLGGHTFDSSEIVDIVFSSVAGCDSVVTVDMAIKKVNDTITVSGSTLNAKSTSGTSYQWVSCPAYVVVPGATSTSFTATLSGSYALIITENGCTDTSDCVAVKGLSIQESHSKALISISPNPSKGIFHLTMPTEMKGVVEIRSIEGRILQSQPFSSKEEVIDLSSYSSGVYFLRINGADGTQQVEKLIKY